MSELSGPRSLENAKEWLLSKLGARVHPLTLTDVETTRKGIHGLAGLDGANWAAAWVAQGDAFAAQAQATETKGDTGAARDNWYQADKF